MHTFIHDIAPKRALRAKVYRSPFRKGKITTLREPALPRGYTCLRARDVRGPATLSCAGYSLPVLAKSEVHYLGEPLLLFCGPHPEVLDRLAAAVQCSCEQQEPVEYKDLTGPYREAQIINLAQGDVDLAFSLAEQIVEGEYQSAARRHGDTDTQGAVANWNGKIMTVHSATQDVYGVRSAVCACLNLPPRKVRVAAVPVGNTMDGKLLSSQLVAVQTALLAHAVGKTVVLIYDREEDLRYSPHGPQYHIRHQTALDREGATLAVRVQIYMDGGCYAPKNCDALRRAVHAAWGAYQIPNLEVIGRTMATDFPPIGPFRASGSAQANFAAELHSSRLEEIAQLDPYQWKRQNLIRPGMREQPTAALSVLEQATRHSDFVRKYSAYSAVKKRRKSIDHGVYPLRGIGLSLARQEAEGRWPGSHGVEAGRGGCAMRLVLEKGKRLRIYSSLTDCAMGIHAMLIQRASELLEIDPQRISVAPVDTLEVPDTGASNLARAAGIGLPLLEQCCQALARKRTSESAPIEVRRSIKAESAGGTPSISRGQWRAEDARLKPSWAATVVELELDPVTFESACRGIWMVIELGSVWNREEATEVLEGEVLRALGHTRMTGCLGVDGGRGRGFSCRDLIPGSEQIPPIHVHILPGEAMPTRGFEQLPHLGVPAAYAAAVSQATGLYIDQLPITPEEIQQCLET